MPKALVHLEHLEAAVARLVRRVDELVAPHLPGTRIGLTPLLGRQKAADLLPEASLSNRRATYTCSDSVPREGCQLCSGGGMPTWLGVTLPAGSTASRTPSRMVR
jgi:hypothetical protein